MTRNVGGTTLHSFIGAGLCTGDVVDMVEMVRRTRAFDEWTSTAALIIDESKSLILIHCLKPQLRDPFR
jgi:hypothetical protein